MNVLHSKNCKRNFLKKNCAYILHELKADNNTFRDIKWQNKLPKGFVIIFYKKIKLTRKHNFWKFAWIFSYYTVQ